MRRWLWILGVILLIVFGNNRQNRLEELEPAQLLYVHEKNGEIMIQTDTGSWGRGSSPEAAWENLRESGTKKVLTETVGWLILEEGLEESRVKSWDRIRPAAEIYRSTDPVDPAAAAEYLKNHSANITLREVRMDRAAIPKLIFREGQYSIAKQ